MPTSHLSYAPEQQLLLLHPLQEWWLQGHLVHYINDTIHGRILLAQDRQEAA